MPIAVKAAVPAIIPPFPNVTSAPSNFNADVIAGAPAKPVTCMVVSKVIVDAIGPERFATIFSIPIPLIKLIAGLASRRVAQKSPSQGILDVSLYRSLSGGGVSTVPVWFVGGAVVASPGLPRLSLSGEGQAVSNSAAVTTAQNIFRDCSLFLVIL